METLFLQVLKQSAAGCVVIAAVLLARLLLKRAPRSASYFLWAVVGFRLASPVSFESKFSLFGFLQRPAAAAPVPSPVPETALAADAVPPVFSAAAAAPAQKAALSLFELAAIGWLLGVAAFLALSAFRQWKLHRSLRTAIRLQKGVYQCEEVTSPFVMGVLRPCIYIPYGLSEPALHCVLAHERYHIRRLDPLARLAASFLLAVHWFNPLVWLAFWLMGRDMELSCDEGVLKKGGADPAVYSETLLSFACPRHAAMPLGFGEVGVSVRIRRALAFKKPGALLCAAAMVFTIGVTVVCAADPARAPVPPAEIPETDQPRPEIPKQLHCETAEHFAHWDGSSDVWEYDAAGEKIRVICYQDDQLVSMEEFPGGKKDISGFGGRYDYQKLDRPRVERMYSTEKDLMWETIYEYDELGHTIRAERDSTIEEFKYDEAGRLVEQKWTLLTDKSTRVSRYRYGQAGQLVEREVESDDGSRELYKYKDGLERMERYEPDGTLERIMETRLDEKGRIIESRDLSPDGSSEVRRTWGYYEDGSVKWQRIEENGILKEMTENDP